MKKKYVLCPDFVVSKNDGEQHFITAHELARLYGVTFGECYVAGWNAGGRQWFGIPKDLPQLYPKYHGDYKSPRTDGAADKEE